MMTRERLLEIIAAYGAEPGRWPAAERSAAEALLATSVEARSAREAALGLDRLLDGLPVPRSDLEAGTVAACAIAAAQDASRRRIATSRRGWFWLAPGVAGLAAAAVAGFFIGWAEVDAARAADQYTDYSSYVARLNVDEDLL
jgi:hypothetical protein